MNGQVSSATAALLLDQSPALFPNACELEHGGWAEVAERYVRHEFDVLGSEWVRVHYGMECVGFEGRNYTNRDVSADRIQQGLPPAWRVRSQELLYLARQYVPGYEPIDWHIDFKSGHRYELVHHKQLQYGLLEGVDAKVSADLSRCYHLVVLALAWRETGEERYLREVLAQILDWLAFNPFQYGAAWRANMNVAIRAVNWAVAFDLVRQDLRPESESDCAFLTAFLASIVDHRRHIADNLEFPEHHIHPNHYIANLAGLLVVCSFSSGWDAETLAWKKLALREVRIELDRQILADGFDFEAATSYHALALEMISYALILTAHGERAYSASDVRGWIAHHIGVDSLGKLRQMFCALRDITQPDGCIPLVGDTDSGRFLYLETLRHNERDWQFLNCVGAALFDDTALLPETVRRGDWTAAQLLLGAKPRQGSATLRSCAAYRDVGFYIMRGQDFFSLISCGPIGTAGKGGHCHNDKLALTLCIDGQEILVDPGVYVYTASKEYRDLYRSVFAHNTVVVAAQEQNRFAHDSLWWGCREDTECRCVRWEDAPERALFVGEHKGYLRLDTPVLHRRHIEWFKRDHRLIIMDEFVSDDRVVLGSRKQFRFMLHSDCRVAVVEGDFAVVERSDVRLELHTSNGEWRASTGFYSPSYGVKQICPTLSIDLSAKIAENTVSMSW